MSDGILSAVERLLARADVGDCWVSTHSTNRKGYPRVAVTEAGSQRKMLAHRLVYEVIVGPIPDGLVLDHLCRNTRCVNPDHMEPVTDRENRRRGIGRHQCGHNRWISDGGGKRRCGPCHAAKQRRYKEEGR